MSEVLDLNQFVDSLSQEGAYDSEGHFTLAEEKARKKLSDFALDEPLSWVFKLLQAVTRWNSVTLEVQQTRLFTSFTFCPSDRDHIPTDKEILEVFESGHVNSEEPLFLFCLALRTLVGRAEMSFLCNARRGDREFEKPLASGADTLSMSNWQRKVWTTLRSDGIKLTVSHVKKGKSFGARFFPVFSKRSNPVVFNSEVTKILAASALFLPASCYLDNRKLNQLSLHPTHGYRRNGQPLILSGVDLKDLGIGPLVVGDHLEEKIMSVFTTPQRANRTYSRLRTFGAWFLVTLQTKQDRSPYSEGSGQLSVTWLKDGVVTGRKVGKLSTHLLNIHIFINGEGFATDISGLNLIRNERTEEIESETLKRVRERVLSFDKEIEDFLGDDLDLYSRHDRHSKIPSFDGKDIDQVTLLDVLTAPTHQILLHGAPFLLGSFSYHFREIDAKMNEFNTRKDELRSAWRAKLEGDFSRLRAEETLPQLKDPKK